MNIVSKIIHYAGRTKNLENLPAHKYQAVPANEFENKKQEYLDKNYIHNMPGKSGNNRWDVLQPKDKPSDWFVLHGEEEPLKKKAISENLEPFLKDKYDKEPHYPRTTSNLKKFNNFFAKCVNKIKDKYPKDANLIAKPFVQQMPSKHWVYHCPSCHFTSKNKPRYKSRVYGASRKNKDVILELMQQHMDNHTNSGDTFI